MKQRITGGNASSLRKTRSFTGSKDARAQALEGVGRAYAAHDAIEWRASLQARRARSLLEEFAQREPLPPF